MGLKVTNNAFGVLNASINSSATTIVLVAGQGARFPTLSAGDYFYATLIDTSNNLEIVKCTARSTDTLTVVRGQDSTTARAYATNDRFELRPTAVLFNETITTAEAALPKAGGVMASGGRIQFQNSDGHTLYGIRGTRYGYSSSYRSLQIGNGANSENIALNVDVSAIAGSSFTGNGKDIVVPNSTQFWTPNSGNTDFILPMAFDSGGRVTMPLQPNASLGLNTSKASAGTIIWTVVHSNVGSCYNSGTGLFTAPVAGYYLAAIMVMTDAAASTLDIELHKNGATNNQLVPYQGGTTIPQYNQVSGMTIILLAANDTISFKLNSGTIYGGGATGRHGACTFRLMG